MGHGARFVMRNTTYVVHFQFTVIRFCEHPVQNIISFTKTHATSIFVSDLFKTAVDLLER